MNVVYEFTEKFYEEQVITRLNRFLIKALVDGKEVNCHLHDQGINISWRH
ncbi:MAG: hypothetical protein QXH75_08015 [Sulfolobaceae archaeon]|jgi:DNA-binding sugar fermentation-stimulating protein